MSADRLGGWLRLWVAVRRRCFGMFDGGGAGDGGAVRLQLTVWEQRL